MKTTIMKYMTMMAAIALAAMLFGCTGVNPYIPVDMTAPQLDRKTLDRYAMELNLSFAKDERVELEKSGGVQDGIFFRSNKVYALGGSANVNYKIQETAMGPIFGLFYHGEQQNHYDGDGRLWFTRKHSNSLFWILYHNVESVQYTPGGGKYKFVNRGYVLDLVSYREKLNERELWLLYLIPFHWAVEED